MHLALRHMNAERKQEEPALPGHGCPWKGNLSMPSCELRQSWPHAHGMAETPFSMTWSPPLLILSIILRRSLVLPSPPTIYHLTQILPLSLLRDFVQLP